MKKFECPFCHKITNNIKDIEVEDHGMYYFECNCGNKFIMPKDTPVVKE